jgi:hypothetical protein
MPKAGNIYSYRLEKPKSPGSCIVYIPAVLMHVTEEHRLLSKTGCLGIYLGLRERQ